MGWHARLVSFLHRQRCDIQTAANLVLNYILSSCPSPTIEDYPRQPPAMSLCVLEAILASDKRPGGWIVTTCGEVVTDDVVGIAVVDRKSNICHKKGGETRHHYDSWFYSFLRRISNDESD